MIDLSNFSDFYKMNNYRQEFTIISRKDDKSLLLLQHLQQLYIGDAASED